MIKSNILKGKIIEANKKYDDCAKLLGISRTAFSNKMNGRSSFRVEEAALLAEYLGLSDDEKFKIFLS